MAEYLVDDLVFSLVDVAARLTPAEWMATPCYVAADMLKDGTIKVFPFSPRAGRIVYALLEDEVAGFIVYNEVWNQTMQVQFAWVDPGFRNVGLFRVMVETLFQRFLMQPRTDKLLIDFHDAPETFAAACLACGFVRENATHFASYRPFEAMAA